MPDLSALLAPLKSPKAALAVFIFSAALLFAPFDRLGLTRPAFTTEYESFFVIILFLSAAILVVELLSKGWRLALRLYYARKRKKRVEETFLSLNLQELCVLWAMTRSGTKTIKGSFSNHLMLSLRQKGCLHLVSGLQSANQLHHAMPDDVFKIVSERGYDRMPDDFKNSVRFEDEVRNIVQAATDPSS
ncbi:hypothetical protein SIAM614_21592 [Stappia aggregata IAM 12614]|uniref:Superinfection exclusion protein B n=1 Tax=Roseibium aggregatum (strain ATCC 25650 / DSM 13394 / JCM 20685 / NBRC 16684 / NCIMB 2208 / IAM 12614 / B1) TaxID=384765 RepID=A0P353_ROSAI|nr:super-infection exclusion protein B [Roseibium aggregatum]EAV40524.1 hypothetical protein SIAM614_21592 [Stappia aggregata IAM 12614] [Roseibium aggregatum IAM 12614]